MATIATSTTTSNAPRRPRPRPRPTRLADHDHVRCTTQTTTMSNAPHRQDELVSVGAANVQLLPRYIHKSPADNDTMSAFQRVESRARPPAKEESADVTPPPPPESSSSLFLPRPPPELIQELGSALCTPLQTQQVRALRMVSSLCQEERHKRRRGDDADQRR